MSITGIGGNGTSAVSQSWNVGRSKAPEHRRPPDLFNGQTVQVDGITISDPGEMFQQLQELQQQDPDKLKQVLKDIADKMRSSASSTTDSSNSSTSAASGSDFRSKMLNELASRFDSAAEDGDLSKLQPPRGGPGDSRGASASYRSLDDEALLDALKQRLEGTSSSSSNSSFDDLIASIRSAFASGATTQQSSSV